LASGAAVGADAGNDQPMAGNTELVLAGDGIADADLFVARKLDQTVTFLTM
jgi:hypothetical protein